MELITILMDPMIANHHCVSGAPRKLIKACIELKRITYDAILSSSCLKLDEDIYMLIYLDRGVGMDSEIFSQIHTWNMDIDVLSGYSY